MSGVIDITARGEGCAAALSNFGRYSFVFDGIECVSMEGLLQAFKFKDVEMQKEICSLVGIAAKKKGESRNSIWQESLILWWQGKPYSRLGREYQKLLDRAYSALAENLNFRAVLLATGNAKLTHSVGEKDPGKTVLTEEEFCLRLTRIREEIQSDGLLNDIERLLEDFYWIPGLKMNRFYERVHDNGGNNTLWVGFGPDGDAWIKTNGKIALRFNMPFGGGGQSPHVRNALMILAYAIMLDNRTSN